MSGGSALLVDAPQRQPQVPLPALPALAPETLTLAFIEQAFSQQIDWQVDPLFADSFDVPLTRYPGLRPAAVLMPLVRHDTGVHLLFTRRSAQLSTHAGQVSFPGGRLEPEDADAVAAALRETQEEIGVHPSFLRIIGQQPSYLTTSQYVMTPIVGVLEPGHALVADSSEVAEIFEVPLTTLMDPRRHRLHQAVLPDGTRRQFLSIDWAPQVIWGATAALLRNFYRYLAAAQHSLRP